MELKDIANKTKEIAKFAIDLVAGKTEQLANGANDLYAKVRVNITNAIEKTLNTGVASKIALATVAAAAVLSAGSAEAGMIADVVNKVDPATSIATAAMLGLGLGAINIALGKIIEHKAEKVQSHSLSDNSKIKKNSSRP